LTENQRKKLFGDDVVTNPKDIVAVLYAKEKVRFQLKL
jgi:hypothetical protein